MSNEVLIDTRIPFDAVARTEVELIDHLFGFKAGSAGQRYDEQKNPAWQRGWADAQELTGPLDRSYPATNVTLVAQF
jgi:hypothetical protein